MIGAAVLLGLVLLALLMAALWLLRPELYTWQPLAGLFDPGPRYFYTGAARGYLPVKGDFPNGFRLASDALLDFSVPGAKPSSAAALEFIDDFASPELAGRPLRVAFFGLLYPDTAASWIAYRSLADPKTLSTLLGSLPPAQPANPQGSFTSLALNWVGAGDTAGYFRRGSGADGALGEYTLVFRSDNYLCVISFIQPLGAENELEMPGYMQGYLDLVSSRLHSGP